jgi:hypothetical protein
LQINKPLKLACFFALFWINYSPAIAFVFGWQYNPMPTINAEIPLANALGLLLVNVGFCDIHALHLYYNVDYCPPA